MNDKYVENKAHIDEIRHKYSNEENGVGFQIYTLPVSSGRPQVNNWGGISYSKSYTDFRRTIRDKMIVQLGYEQFEEMRLHLKQFNAFKIDMMFNFHTINEDFWGYPKLTRPDNDNIIKSVWDGIFSDIFEIDDKAIFGGTFHKQYASENSIIVNIEPMVLQEFKKVARKKGTYVATGLTTTKEKEIENILKGLNKYE